MPGVIDLWDLLPIYLFEIRNTEKRKRNPSKRKIIQSLVEIAKFLNIIIDTKKDQKAIQNFLENNRQRNYQKKYHKKFMV